MSAANPKLIYIFDAADWKSRLPTAIVAREANFEVVLVLIGEKVEIPGDFKIKYVPAPQGKLSAGEFVRMVKELKAILSYQQPDLVHAVTLKYAFLAGIAEMSFPFVRKVYTLAGLGYLFRGDSGKAKILRSILARFLKMVLKNRMAWLIFQNPDDMKLMEDLGYAEPSRSVLIRGSGVNLKTFTFTPEPHSDMPIVLMPTRLVHDKGIAVFVEAARLLKLRGVQARFQIAGGLTRHNPKAITETEMKEFVQDGSAEWLGRVDDMPKLLSSASLIVYPSYYGEGIPRVLLEACAAGRAIITTDHPGCREAVRANENGLLVPVKDVTATANAIEKLLKDNALRLSMGARSRALAESEFDARLIAQQTCDVYKKALKN